ncbi:hypothetical protein EDB89DRAFT_109054 [Lactarius sanguifluus]|nr:hypothetical protein EDB89DRAFT_109054 [Lactarius sanguifluus]
MNSLAGLPLTTLPESALTVIVIPARALGHLHARLVLQIQCAKCNVVPGHDDVDHDPGAVDMGRAHTSPGKRLNFDLDSLNRAGKGPIDWCVRHVVGGAGATTAVFTVLASRLAMRSCGAIKRTSCPSRNAQSPLLLPLPLPPPARYPNLRRSSSNCKDAGMCLSGEAAATGLARGCAGTSGFDSGGPRGVLDGAEAEKQQPNSSWGGPKSLGLTTLTVPPRE